MKYVSPLEAQTLMEDGACAYIDVRTVPEFEAGHPRGAFNVPWCEVAASGLVENLHFVEQIERRFGSASHLIVGCQTNTRAVAAAGALILAGFEHVVVQRAGMEGLRDAFGRNREPGWQALGLPVATQAEKGHSHAEIATNAETPAPT